MDDPSRESTSTSTFYVFYDPYHLFHTIADEAHATVSSSFQIGKLKLRKVNKLTRTQRGQNSHPGVSSWIAAAGVLK